MKDNKARYIHKRIISTVAVASLLVSMLLLMVNYIYNAAEDEAFEGLHVETKEIKDNIKLQMVSDRENLTTMANFASKLYSDGEGYDLLFKSYEAIGLIENIGILTRDNKFITRVGQFDSTQVNFSQEVARGDYISGRVADITTPDREVVRSAVPIISQGDVVGILYGVIELDTLEERYKEFAEGLGAKLYIIERGNGNMIIDTRNDHLGNISSFKERKAKKGFSYKKMHSDIMSGNSGYSAYLPGGESEYHYAHYSSVGISDWQIMLAKPESVVFKTAKKTERTMFTLFSIIVLIMAVYLIIIFSSERKQTVLNVCASKIRKLLLEVSRNDSSIIEALEGITDYSKSRSAFFADTDGEDFNHIVSLSKDKLLKGEDRAYFVSQFMEYGRKLLKGNNATVVVDKIFVNNALKEQSEEFYKFLTQHGIESVCVSYISNKPNNISLLGVVNPKKHKNTKILLEEIAVCFAMAIYNKKYLARTETIAVTDSLTGLSNRLAYKKDVDVINEIKPEKFSCIYIDVNELHSINNKYGHAAGDGMLLFIANTLREIFKNEHIYRMGGDEFLVFVENTDKEQVDNSVKLLSEKVESMNYHISVGIDFRHKNIETETLVKEAEKRMYEAKAEYYQKKERKNYDLIGDNGIEHINTGIREFDTLLSIISRRYNGIYSVSLKTDLARRILMPSYFKQFSEDEDNFSKVFSIYVHDMVNPDYHRPLLNFLKYDVLKRQLMDGHSPSISYVNSAGKKIVLSVYALPGQSEDVVDTLWVFENKN